MARMRPPTYCGWIGREVLVSPTFVHGGLERCAGGDGLTVRTLGRLGTNRRLNQHALSVLERRGGTITALSGCLQFTGRAPGGPAGVFLIATQPLETSSVFTL